jgi:hypothetical protein
MADSDAVPGYMKSPERLQQLRRRAVGEDEEPEVRHKTEDEMMQENLQFRALFEQEAFDIKRDAVTGLCLKSPQTANTSKSKSKREWDLMVHLIGNWNTGAEGLSMKDFRAKYIDRHKNWTSYFVTVNKAGHNSLWYQHPIDGKKKRVVNIEQVFDVIYAYHSKAGHQGVSTTHLSIADAYYNVTRKQVKSFVQLCPVCNEKQPKVKPFKGAAKPIESFRFRDRFQVCNLLDPPISFPEKPFFSISQPIYSFIHLGRLN